MAYWEMSRRQLLAVAGGLLTAAMPACRLNLRARHDTGMAPDAQRRPLRSGIKLTFMGWGALPQQEVMKRAAEEFGRRYPGLEAQYLSSEGEDHYAKLTTMIAGDVAPDVFYMGVPETPGWAARGVLAELDRLLARDKIVISDFFEKAVAQYYWKGRLYALPRGFGNQVLYLNTGRLAEAGLSLPPADWNDPGWTVQEFLDYALRLTRREGDSTVQWGYSQGRGLRQWAPWVWMFGGEIFDKDGTVCLLGERPAVEGLQFLQDLIHRHRVMPAPGATGGMGDQQLFAAGRLAMRMDIPAQVVAYRRMSGVSFDVAPMPRAAVRVTSGGGVGWAMFAQTKSLEEAWVLHQWVTSREVQTWECEAGTTAPPRKSVIRLPCYVDPAQPPSRSSVFVQAPDFVHIDPQSTSWSEIEPVIERELQHLWAGTKNARQIADALVPEVNRLLREAPK
jgi:multiple sugar transport system substrate-binding protein